MAQVIKIKRSNSTASPTSLSAGELAYSSNSNKLFVGHPQSAAVTAIGGAVYVNMLDHTAGTLTASSAVLVDANSKIDQLKAGNTVITGSNDTISTSSGALTLAPTGNLIVTHGGSVDLDAQATSILIKDNEGASIDFNENGTSYLKLVTTNSSELVVVGKDITFANDASLLSDAAVLNFGADKDVSLTHVADTGLLLNGAMEVQFRDSALTVGSSADGQLDIDADTEVEITAPTLDINATTTDVSGTFNSVGNLTVATNKFTVASGTGNTVVAGTLTANGAADLDSTLNVDGATTLNGGVTLGNASGDAITVTGTATFGQSADFDGGLTVAGSQTIDMGANRVTNIATPTASTDATTKAYVDSVKQALDIKDSVKLATTANLGATYNNGSGTLTMDSTGTVTIDGTVTALNDRILVMDQSSAEQNGIYYVSTAGAVGVAGVFTRAADANANSEVTGGMFTFVEAGSSNADNAYVLTSITGDATLGSSTLTFTQFSGAGQVTAGNGLAKSGNTLSVNVDDQTLSISSDTLQLKGIADTANGDILYGANGGSGGYSALSIGTYDSTNSVGQILQVGASSTVAWSNTLDGGTF
tara:strand:+ start:658 stop:2430 length:1773 start_codon:yes stop_codon:yes gene_type:complete